MTDPHEPDPNVSPGASGGPTAPSTPDGATAPTAPIASTTPPPEQSATSPADDRVRVKRSWIAAGAGVSAVALLGLGFGLGYITGDQTGNHGHHAPRHDRGEMMRGGVPGDMPGEMFGPGRRWRGVPPNMDEKNPTTPGQPDQNPQTSAPTTPGTPS